MVSAEAARTTVGILGNISAFIMFASPLPTFVRIWKKGSVEQYSAAPYLATIVNCTFWTMYGLPMVHPHNVLLATVNSAGMVMELCFLLLFVCYSDGKKRLRVVLVLVAEAVAMGCFAAVVLVSVHTTKQRSTIVGSMAVVGCVLMYAAPLSIMRLVISTRSVEYMPFSISMACFVNGICWTSYALIGTFDPFVIVPNGLGAVLGLAQIILYAVYYKSTKKQLMDQQSKSEMGLAQMTLSGGAEKMSKAHVSALDRN